MKRIENFIIIAYYMNFLLFSGCGGSDYHREAHRLIILKNALHEAVLEAKILAVDVLKHRENMQNIQSVWRSEEVFKKLQDLGVEQIWVNANLKAWYHTTGEGYDEALEKSAVKIKMPDGECFELTFLYSFIRGETQGVEWIIYSDNSFIP